MKTVKKERKNGWSKLELEILRNRWKNAEPSEWIHLLPNRTYFAIKEQSQRLKLKRDLSIFSKKKKFKCEICGKIFFGYGNRRFCSTSCVAKYMSETRLGENNPAFNPHKFKKTNCLNCGLEFEYKKGGSHGIPKFCSRKCFQEHEVQEEASRWEGGIQFLPYSNEFNKRLKKHIKKRDGNKCVFCGREKNLIVHHINYDKMDSKKSNLITLCKICHGMTNNNRYFWQTVFQFLMSGYQIVKKGWGFEFIPISNNYYCLKALVFYPNKRFSDHYHVIKNESWYCLEGKLLAKLTLINGEIEEFIFKKGEVLEINPFLCHQLIAIEPSILLEVSTKDDEKDSYRVKKGD